jgi:hypothetical protein
MLLRLMMMLLKVPAARLNEAGRHPQTQGSKIMSVIPSMSKRHFVLIAEVIKTLPPQCRNLVAWRFARALMGTNKDFRMSQFISACGCDVETIERDLKL